MSRIIVVGGGGHAKVLTSTLRKCGYSVVGYTDPQDRGTLLGAPYLGGDEGLPALAERLGCREAALGVGKIDVSSARTRLGTDVVALGFVFPVIVSPVAVVNDEVHLGAGTAVFDGAVVNSGTVVGDLCILNSHSTVEHDCRLGDNVHIATGATVCGGVTIGADCMVGAGSTVIEEVTICAACLIGAGSTVVGDLSRPGTYVGSPARRIR